MGRRSKRPPTVWSGAARGTTTRRTCAAYRYLEPSNRNNNLGFRLCRAHDGAGWLPPEFRRPDRRCGRRRMVVCGRRASSPARTRRRTLAGRFSLRREMPTTRNPPRAWTHPLQRGIPPTWASEWGEDRLHGPWCALEVNDVVQRLRWIPPGVFWMGSPEDEEGRYPHERPRRLVSDRFRILDV